MGINIDKVANINTLLIIVGFFTFGMIGNFLPGNDNSRLVTVPFRGLVLVMSILVIFNALFKGLYISRLHLPFIIFFVIYILRVFIDLYIREIHATVFVSNYEYMLHSVGVIFLPCLAIMYTKIDFDWLLKWAYIFLTVALTFSLFTNLDTGGDSPESGRFSTAATSTISYGHQGVTLALLSLYIISQKLPGILGNKLINILTFCLGVITILLAGSKSPFLALIICLIFFYLSSKGFFKGLLVIITIISPFIIFKDFIIQLVGSLGGRFFLRLEEALNSGDEARKYLVNSSLEQFADSPILGKAFVLSGNETSYWNGFYPHNLITESLMALGLVGGMLILILIFKSLYEAYYLINNRNPHSWLGVILLQYTILAMFSMAIYTNYFFWAYLVLVACAYKNARYQE